VVGSSVLLWLLLRSLLWFAYVVGTRVPDDTLVRG